MTQHVPRLCCLLGCLLALLVTGACGTDTDRGAVVAETRGDTAVVDTLDRVDSTVDDTGESDAQETTLLSEDPPSCHVDPVLLYDEVIVADGAGLRGFPVATTIADVEGRTLATWGDDEAPAHVAGAPRASGGAELVVTLQSQTSPCTLVGYDRAGAELWRHPSQAQACLPPFVDDAVVLWATPIASQGLLIVDRATGERVDTVVLADGPTTGLITLKPNDSRSGGGGSHWLVGTDAGVHGVRRTIVGAYEASGRLTDRSHVTALALLAPEIVLATLRGPEERGFGSMLQTLVVSWSADGAPALAPQSGPITAPGPLASAPIGTGRCGMAGGGGSHWWCPSGAIVAGGDGWLRVWSSVSGTQRAAVDAPGTWTQLTMTADGGIVGVLIAADGGYAYSAYDAEFNTVETLMASDAPDQACAGAPVLNAVGQLAAHLGPLGQPAALIRVDRDVAGLAAGWPRPGGDARNQQVTLSDPQQCGDGFQRFLAPIPVTGLTPSALADTAEHYVVGGEVVTGGPWLGWFDRDGTLRSGGAIPGPGSPNGPVVALATRTTAAETVVFLDRRVVQLRSPTLQGFGTDALTPAWSMAVEGAGFSFAAGMALDPLTDTAFLLAASDSGEGALVVKVDVAAKVEVGSGWREPGGTEPTAIAARVGGGVVVAGSGADVDGQHAWITALNPDLTSPWRQTIPLAGDEPAAVSLVARADGGVWAIVAQQESDSGRNATTLHTFSAAGVSGPVVPAADDRILWFAADPGGDALAIDVDFGIRPITRGLGVASSNDPFIGAGGLVPTALHSLGGGAYLALGQRDGEQAVLVRVGPHGRASCDAVGLCVWVAPDSCRDADPCTTDSCVPATGACENVTAVELCPVP